MTRVFLLSPARADGVRMNQLLRPGATFGLARRVQEGGATLGEAFSFASGLYFRGKLAYAKAFARPGPGAQGALVIAPGRGLVDADRIVRAEDLRAMGEVEVDAANARYRGPLERDAAALAKAGGEVVLLGSIASGKYADVLLGLFGDRLLFPTDFVGRGDMSRGGLLLRAVRAGAELACAPLAGAVRRGSRPPRLPPVRRG